MNRFQRAYFFVLVGALGACSQKTTRPESPTPPAVSSSTEKAAPTATNTQKNTSESSKPSIEGARGNSSTGGPTQPSPSTGILSYSLHTEIDEEESSLIHSIEIEGPLAEQYLIRFCYRKNCWGDADFRISCRNNRCELEVADHDNPGKFNQARRASINLIDSPNSASRRLMEFIDPFFTEPTADFYYQVWTSSDQNGSGVLSKISQPE